MSYVYYPIPQGRAPMMPTRQHARANNILNAPDNIGEIRKRFFLLETPIFQSRYEHEFFWPFVDNFWVRNKCRDAPDCRTEYYFCRLHKKQETKSAVPEELRKRKCAIRAAVGCDMKLRKRFFNDGSVEIIRQGDCRAHCHSLDEMDRTKRNSAVRLATSAEIGKGYKIQEVRRVLTRDPKFVADVGGQYMETKDYHNAARPFKENNKDNSVGNEDTEAQEPEPQEPPQERQDNSHAVEERLQEALASGERPAPASEPEQAQSNQDSATKRPSSSQGQRVSLTSDQPPNKHHDTQ